MLWIFFFIQTQRTLVIMEIFFLYNFELLENLVLFDRFFFSYLIIMKTNSNCLLSTNYYLENKKIILECFQLACAQTYSPPYMQPN